MVVVDYWFVLCRGSGSFFVKGGLRGRWFAGVKVHSVGSFGVGVHCCSFFGFCRGFGLARVLWRLEVVPVTRM